MDTSVNPKLIDGGPEVVESGLVHRVLQPAGPGPYPTAILLHGRMGNENVMWVFRRTIPRHWLILAPRAPVADPGGRYSWHVQARDAWPTLAEFAPGISALARFLLALSSLYNADSERLYLAGFSQGAAIAFGTAFAYPESARGIAGLVGFAPMMSGEAVRGRLSHLPIFMAVGRQDERVPYEQSHRSVELLRDAGAELDYHEYDTGHKLTAEGFRDLQTWWQART